MPLSDARNLYVRKRDGQREAVNPDKLLERMRRLGAADLDLRFVRFETVVRATLEAMRDDMTGEQLDALLADTVSAHGTYHPDYSVLAGRLAASALHRATRETAAFSAAMECVHAHNPQLFREGFLETVRRHAAALDAAIVHERDLQLFDYFGFKSLESKYLLRVGAGKAVIERPQHMYMRVAVGLHGDDLPAVLETYDLLSRQLYSHATPTMFNAGLRQGQLASCFLSPFKDDSIEGIYRTASDAATISKMGGGVGLSLHDIRPAGSPIRGSNGTSTGIVPMLRVFDATACYVDQGGNKRKGGFAIYAEPWHGDIEDFLLLRKNHGAEMARARALFYALWVPDLFMRRVQRNESWTLFCPRAAPGLHSAYGEAFDKLYEQYEQEGRGIRQVSARDLWNRILTAQIENGQPYMLYKDACNAKSNHRHLGTIQSSNLCAEIVQYSSRDEIAVCNLASVNLAAFAHAPATHADVSLADFDFQGLYAVTRVAVRNLNRTIDVTTYCLPETKRSNLRHRPVGLGVQGLADVFAELHMPFESLEARVLNARIFETMYYAALDESCEQARLHGPYESYAGSPVEAEGLLQMDLWRQRGEWSEESCVCGTAARDANSAELHALLDWPALRARIRAHGLRNSLLIAVMPTASTAQIIGNNESVAPYMFNVYKRRVLAGEFMVVNRRMVRELARLGLWDEKMRMRILQNRGSVQGLTDLPERVRAVFKTAFEISQRAVMDQAADRGPYVCQSQSMNVCLADPTLNSLTVVHFHGWRSGLKTGMYYLHTRPAAEAVRFTLDDAGAAAASVAAQEQVPDEHEHAVCESCQA